MKRIIMVFLVIGVLSATVYPQTPIWPEARGFVGEMYNRILARNGNKLEILNKVLPLMRCEITREAVIISMFSSGEYAGRNRSNRQFMNDVYISILRRNPSPGETYGWIGALSSGNLTRMQAVNLFLNSYEYLNNIEKYENDCIFAEDVAFYHIFPGGGYTIQDFCDVIILDLPELNKFELSVRVKGLQYNHSYPYKGQVFFLGDTDSMGNTWTNTALVRKYGYFYPHHNRANMLKWAFTLDDLNGWEGLLGPYGWSPETVYEFKIVVNGNPDYGIQLFMNGELLVASTQTCPWNPVDQILYIGSPACHDDEGAGNGSIPGATYISVRMINTG